MNWQKLLNVIRWIGVLPASLLGGRVGAAIPNTIISYIADRYYGGLILDEFLLLGFGFVQFYLGAVLVGYFVAPSHKRIVVIFLTMLFIPLWIVMLFMSDGSLLWMCIDIILFAITVAVVVFYVCGYHRMKDLLSDLWKACTILP